MGRYLYFQTKKRTERTEDDILHRNRIRRKILLVLGILCMGAGGYPMQTQALKIPAEYTVPENVSQLAVVRNRGGSRGRFQFYIKNAKGKCTKVATRMISRENEQ